MATDNRISIRLHYCSRRFLNRNARNSCTAADVPLSDVTTQHTAVPPLHSSSPSQSAVPFSLCSQDTCNRLATTKKAPKRNTKNQQNSHLVAWHSSNNNNPPEGSRGPTPSGCNWWNLLFQKTSTEPQCGRDNLELFLWDRPGLPCSGLSVTYTAALIRSPDRHQRPKLHFPDASSPTGGTRCGCLVSNRQPDDPHSSPKDTQ